MAKKSGKSNIVTLESIYGENVFGLKNMKKYLSPKTYAVACRDA